MTPNLETQQFILRAVILTLCFCLAASLLAMVAVATFRDGISTTQLMQYLVEIVWGLLAGLGGILGTHILRNPIAATVTAEAPVIAAAAVPPVVAPPASGE